MTKPAWISRVRISLERLSNEAILNGAVASSLVNVNFRRLALRIYGIQIPNTTRVAQRVRLAGRNIKFGAHCHVTDGCFIDDAVTLGDRVNVGPRAMLLTGTHDIGPHECRRVNDVTKPVQIGDGCWIGAGAIILPGVTVGAGCVVGAGAVVTKDTAPDGLYVGSPARRVRSLPTSQPRSSPDAQGRER